MNQLTAFLAAMLLTASASLSLASGGSNGGGGDTSEIRVNDIRVDILSWIAQDGSKGLHFPAGMTNKIYREKMRAVLAPQVVVIGFVTTQQEQLTKSPEQKVEVGGVKKTCRGFTSTLDHRQHILCNDERFNALDQTLQYQLIHHEYAGLAGLEHNKAASSDYVLSSQITKYLQPVTVLKLALSSHSISVDGAVARAIYDSAESLEIGGDQGMHHGLVKISGFLNRVYTDNDYMFEKEVLTMQKCDSGSGATIDTSKLDLSQDYGIKRALNDLRHALEDVAPSKFIKTKTGWVKTMSIKTLECRGMVEMEDDNIRDFAPDIGCDITF